MNEFPPHRAYLFLVEYNFGQGLLCYTLVEIVEKSTKCKSVSNFFFHCSASAILNMPLVKKHLALFIEEKENLLHQRGNKDDSECSPHQQGLANRSKAQGRQ